MKTYRKGLLSTALWILLTVTCHAQTTWTITEVPLGFFQGRVINNSGQVVGSSSPDGVNSHAFLWSSGSGAQDLGTLPGATCNSSNANGINNSGQVAGTSCSSDSSAHVFLWSNASGMQDLGTVGDPGFNGGVAAINDSGQIAGQKPVPNALHCFLWSSGAGAQDLGTLGGNCQASGINNSGQVVGSDNCARPCFGQHAFLWSGGMQDLGTLPGDQQSAAYGINDSGQIVGGSGGNEIHAFLWSSGLGMQDLGALPGSGGGIAYGINNSGQVVGESSGRAFLWSSGVMTDLSTFPEVQAASWSLLQAFAINDVGQIVGLGVHLGSQHFFLLSPSGPSPKTAGACPSAGQGTGDPNKPDPCPFGNPINPFTGNKYQIETDYVGAGAYPLRFERYYNSNTGSGSGRIGAKWRHTFDRAVSVSGARATVFRPDGKQFVFTQSGANWVAPADVMDRLTQITNGWIYTTAPNDEVESYDASGRLVSIANRAGVAHAVGYDASGRLASVTHSLSAKTLTFLPDASGRIASMTDPAGKAFSYGYDAPGNLSSVTYPNDTPTNPLRTYVYNEPANTSGANLPNHLTGILDENTDRFATYKFAADGRVLSSEHAGAVSKYSVVYNSTTSTVTDPLNTARNFGFQTLFEVPKHTSVDQPCDHCGLASSITYDANGYLSGATNFNGVAFSYGHDARGLEGSRTEAVGTAQVRTISTQWHPTFRLAAKVAEPLRITSYVYNGDGGASCGFKADGVTLVPGVLCSKTVQATTDATGAAGFGATLTGAPRTWSYTYHANGQVLSATGPRTDVAQVTNYAYYPNNDPDTGRAGQLMSVTNPLRHITTIDSYDLNGRPTQITDPNGTVSVLSYHPRGWLTSRRVGSTLAGELTSFDYDGVGQLKTITFPDLSTLTYTYDAAHRLTDITDSLGNKITYTPDSMGNRTREDTKDPLGTIVKTLSRVYNSLNRLAQLIGAQPNELTEFTLYDGNGNLKQKQERLAHTPAIITRQSDYGYDALNRLITMIDGASPRGTTSYAYDGLDQLNRVTDPRNNLTGYTVDGLGNLTQVSSPDTGVLTRDPTTGFDAAGNVKIETDAAGRTRTYTYDALDRVTQVVHTKTGLPTVTVGFGYDEGINGTGRLTSMSDPSGSTAWEYDLRGRVTRKTQTVAGLVVPFVVQYHYDAAGRMDSLTFPSATVLSYGFDANGRVSDISRNTTPATPLITSAAYFSFGPVRTFQFGNNQAVIRSFDSDGRLSSYPLSDQTRALGYDDGSRITLNQKPDATDPRSFDYDTLDRLTSYIAPGASQSFGYDANGNRASQAIGADNNTYNYAAGDNRLASVVSSAGSKLYSYDATGNQTGVSGLQVHSYTYDARGRMISADNQAASYLVNGLGQRVQKTIASSASTTFFVYDEAGKLLGEYDASGAPVQELVYLNDLPVASLRGVNIYYIWADQLNTPRQITNATNQLVWRWDTDPFGITPADENPLGLGPFSFNLRFPGQYFDRETNLAYNYFRDYDSSIGRYVQSDPIGLRGGINTYAYVGGSPLTRTDPKGLEPIGTIPSDPNQAAIFYNFARPRASTGCGCPATYSIPAISVAPGQPIALTPGQAIGGSMAAGAAAGGTVGFGLGLAGTATEVSAVGVTGLGLAGHTAMTGIVLGTAGGAVFGLALAGAIIVANAPPVNSCPADCPPCP